MSRLVELIQQEEPEDQEELMRDLAQLLAERGVPGYLRKEDPWQFAMDLKDVWEQMWPGVDFHYPITPLKEINSAEYLLIEMVPRVRDD
ncbi:MAG: hypothetical protein EOM92_21460 [Gammaproteobacteria bacterium]|nr:hypothetical protein [Gammaproteobacteria bacterium]